MHVCVCMCACPCVVPFCVHEYMCDACVCVVRVCMCVRGHCMFPLAVCRALQSLKRSEETSVESKDEFEAKLRDSVAEVARLQNENDDVSLL